jgi:hypothetical protein
MLNNRKFNNRYRLQPIAPVRPLWIDLVVLLISAGICAFAGFGALALLNTLK